MQKRACHQPSRRSIVTGITGWLSSGLAQTSPAESRKLDVHHHFFAPALAKKFIANLPTPQPILEYTPLRSIEAMDQAGVGTAILSCPVPFGDAAALGADAISIARELNDYGAKMTKDYPERFGLFAVLPLPNIEASLREIEYSLDVLKADGIGVTTSYGNHWLGDKSFQPVFDELNRRHAVVYAHPVDAPCCRNLMPGTGPQIIEWNTDTSRAIWSMINDGGNPAAASMATRYNNIRFIWSHGGGSLLGLVGRFLGPVAMDESLLRRPEPDSKLYHLRRFYYDTAGCANRIQMQALKTLVGTSQIVFGSDFPFGPIRNVAEGLARCGFSAEELRSIYRENAVKLRPNWK